MIRPLTTTSDLARRRALAAILTVAGAGVIATSFVWPGESSQRRAWSSEQAKQYQAAASKLHSLSHEMAHAKPGRDVTIRKKLEAAKTEYNALRSDLDLAISRPRRWAWTMRLFGALAMILGGILLYTRPNDK